MTFFEWLALFGALAWLPPIIQLLYYLAQRTKIEILVARTIEIGYSNYGPIINLNLGFMATNKDVLVIKTEIELTHEKHERNIFVWKWAHESLMELIGPKGEILPYMKKTPEVSAIKVGTDNIIEKKIGFQIDGVWEEGMALFDRLLQLQIDMANIGQNLANIRVHDLYRELLHLNDEKFIWKTGTYTAIIKAQIRNGRWFSTDVKFQLSHTDIEKLSKNKKEMIKSIDSELIENQLYSATWQWVYARKIDSP